MSLKRRIALNLSLAFSILFGVVVSVIYLSFYNFRSQEFKDRLQDRAISTANFIGKIKNVDSNMMNLFDKNSADPLYQEQTLVFNENKQLIYSSVSDKEVKWDDNLLESLDKKDKVFTQNQQFEYLGISKKIKGKKFYILTRAEDYYGRNKLNFLKFLLLFMYFLSTFIVWVFSQFFVKNMLKPLDNFQQKITEITAHKLTSQLPENKTNDEISLLARAFNSMMLRLNDVFQSQKDFTASASHEIRTPLTRIAFQLENLALLEEHSPTTKSSLKNISQDIHHLSDLTNSLLLLSKFDKENIQSIFKEERIDEIIFKAHEDVLKNFPDLKMDFVIDNLSQEEDLSVKCIKSLLEIVFVNLFKNAAIYSVKPEFKVVLSDTKSFLNIKVINFGKTISQEEQSKLFEAFMRGENAQNIAGSGLGLRIAKRILEYHKAEIFYRVEDKNVNIFNINFPKI